MITVYAFSTPNSVRVPVALEELQLEYEIFHQQESRS
jgi:glutathione S-transferase